MILPHRCAVTSCRNMAETAKKMGCWSLDVVTAHTIELRAGDGGASALFGSTNCAHVSPRR